MIWIDIATPKYALFFSKLIPLLDDEVLITIRYSKGYEEIKNICDLHNLKYHIVGNYGGKNIKDKFLARLKRSEEFVNLFEEVGYPKLFISGGVADSTQVAFGLGIKIINIYDTPIVLEPNYETIHNNLTAVSRLTTPFSDIVFYPWILPKELFCSAKKAISYNFIDVCLWMNDIKKDENKDFRDRFNIPKNRPTILVREEEYKAHYVKEKKNYIYEFVKMLQNENINIAVIPRYEDNEWKKFDNVYLVNNLKPEEFYPFIDFFIGGGGTMTLESVYYGIPTISMRSLWMIHDKYLVDNNLMFWTNDLNKAYKYFKENLGKKFDNKKYFGNCDVRKITTVINKFLLNKV